MPPAICACTVPWLSWLLCMPVNQMHVCTAQESNKDQSITIDTAMKVDMLNYFDLHGSAELTAIDYSAPTPLMILCCCSCMALKSLSYCGRRERTPRYAACVAMLVSITCALDLTACACLTKNRRVTACLYCISHRCCSRGV